MTDTPNDGLGIPPKPEGYPDAVARLAKQAVQAVGQLPKGWRHLDITHPVTGIVIDEFCVHPEISPAYAWRDRATSWCIAFHDREMELHEAEVEVVKERARILREAKTRVHLNSVTIGLLLGVALTIAIVSAIASFTA